MVRAFASLVFVVPKRLRRPQEIGKASCRLNSSKVRIERPKATPGQPVSSEDASMRGKYQYPNNEMLALRFCTWALPRNQDTMDHLVQHFLERPLDR